jgi:DNA mismatch repair protein MutL
MTPEFADMYKKVFGMEVSDVRKEKEEENVKLDVSNAIQLVGKEDNISVFENNSVDEDESMPELKYRFIGVIFNKYAIIEVKDEMYMIEKTAAEERLMYEKVKKNYYEEENKDSQMLLLADIVTLTGKEMSIAKDALEMFKNAGFDYEEFGETTIKLVSVPSWAEAMNTKNLFLDIIREMDTVAVTEKQEKVDSFIITVACKAASQSSSSLTDSEIEDLVKRLLKLPSPFVYPNGKLTAIKISKANMEKKFSRR